MNQTVTILIRSELDIVKARMCVRDLARLAGLPLGDQARISLAASSLAQAMQLATGRGRLVANRLNGDARPGIQVVCTRDTPCAIDPEALGNVRWMVDELSLEGQVARATQVTLVKWAT